MKYTQVAEDMFKKLQLNAGVLLRNFDPETGTLTKTDIVGATSGGVNFKATPTFVDFGEDVDNVPNDTKELKKITGWEVLMSGTFLTVDIESVKELIGAGDVSGNKATPRINLKDEDFKEIWWVGDYSDENGTNGGFIAIKMMNTLSNAGFQIQTGKDVKGQFAFEFKAHKTIANVELVPYEVYVKAGEAA